VPYLVGENGPELFVPSGSGTIMANSTLGSSAGVGGGINVTITGNTISNNLDIRKLADKVGEAIVGRLRQNGRY
jgi:phage-related minor tail protein